MRIIQLLDPTDHMTMMHDWPTWLHTQDEDTGIPVVRRWEDMVIMVAGGAGKHSSCVPTFGATRSVTREITGTA